MKILKFQSLALITLGVFFAAFTNVNKLISNKTHIRFYSSTPAENIEANNYKSTATLDIASGDVVFSVPMQSFEFEKALMQKHFNQPDFLDSKQYPTAKFVGKVSDMNLLNLEKEGLHKVKVVGQLTIKGKTNPINVMGDIVVEGKEIRIKSIFEITLADYGIVFVKGKPSTNVAKSVEITVSANFNK
jgi:polyisoprenoid-binding protein YceI